MAPSWLAATDKHANQLSSFRISTGGNCEFFLDEATGDCLFAGQYTNQVYRPQTDGVPSQGTFVQRYSPTATLRLHGWGLTTWQNRARTRYHRLTRAAEDALLAVVTGQAADGRPW